VGLEEIRVESVSSRGDREDRGDSGTTAKYFRKSREENEGGGVEASLFIQPSSLLKLVR
jgi:hypothetical protein